MRAGHIQQTLINTALHRIVKDLKKFGSYQRLGAAQTREKCWLKLSSKFTPRKILIPKRNTREITGIRKRSLPFTKQKSREVMVYGRVACIQVWCFEGSSKENIAA